MSEIFVSYKREDEARVERLVSALRDCGLSVWWDRDIPGASGWRAEIERHLDAARCVVVCWSVGSIGPEAGFVHDEAGRAKRRGVLIPILLDRVDPPLGFGDVQALGLVGWGGKASDPRLVDVCETARAVIKGEPRPKPKAAAIRARRAIGATGAISLVGAVLAFAGDIGGTQHAVCKISVVREQCAVRGLGGVPTKLEEESFKAAKLREDGQGLRKYLNDFPGGAFANEAKSLLAACHEVIDERWKPDKRRLDLFVRRAETASESESAARAAILAQGQADSTRVCRGFEQGDTHRLKQSSADVRSWRCDQKDDGWYCGFDGEAICDLEIRTRTPWEVCR